MRAGAKVLLLGFLGLLMLWGSLGVGRFSVEAAPAPQAEPTSTRPPVPPLATATPEPLPPTATRVPPPPKEDSDAGSAPSPPTATPTSTPVALLPASGHATGIPPILWVGLGLLMAGAVAMIGLARKIE
jgi:hypothetical protein